MPPAAPMTWPSSCAGLSGEQWDCTCTATTFHVGPDVPEIPPNAFARCYALTQVTGIAAVTTPVGE